jgi:hypothetical protein
MKKFEKAQVRDKVYSLIHGEGIITFIASSGMILLVQFNNGHNVDYYSDGRYLSNDVEPTLFWNKPTLSNDPPPKRMIKKTVTKYLNLYKDGRVQPFNTLKGSQILGQTEYLLVSGQEVTFEYEVEE